MTAPKIKVIRNEKGILVFDFIFAFMIMMGMMVILLALNFTLSVTEGLQYIAFSTSRVFYAADINPQAQMEEAQAKYQQVKALEGFTYFLSPQWFELPSADNVVGNFADAYEAQDTSREKNFWGTRIDFQAKMLSFNLPILGPTGEESDFSSSVSSFLGREPTMQECIGAMGAASRLQAILELDERFKSLPVNTYYVIGDNGC